MNLNWNQLSVVFLDNFFDLLVEILKFLVPVNAGIQVVDRKDEEADDRAEEHGRDDAPYQTEDTEALAALAVLLARMDSDDGEDPVEREQAQECRNESGNAHSAHGRRLLISRSGLLVNGLCRSGLGLILIYGLLCRCRYRLRRRLILIFRHLCRCRLRSGCGCRLCRGHIGGIFGCNGGSGSNGCGSSCCNYRSSFRLSFNSRLGCGLCHGLGLCNRFCRSRFSDGLCRGFRLSGYFGFSCNFGLCRRCFLGCRLSGNLRFSCNFRLGSRCLCLGSCLRLSGNLGFSCNGNYSAAVRAETITRIQG